MSQQRTKHFIHPQRLGSLAQFQRKLPLLPRQLEKHIGFIAQDMWLYRLINEIHSPGFVAAEHAVLVARFSGDENKRDLPGSLATPQQFCQFEPVHFRHTHIKECQCHVVHQQ